MGIYYKYHREAYRQLSREYYQKHREEEIRKKKEYYAKNREKILKKIREMRLKYTPRSVKHTTKRGLWQLLRTVAKKNNFTISPLADKIVAAKLRMCPEDLKRCPCDNKPDSLRWCGSVQCVTECENNGRCHCGLFYASKGGKKKCGC